MATMNKKWHQQDAMPSNPCEVQRIQFPHDANSSKSLLELVELTGIETRDLVNAMVVVSGLSNATLGVTS